MTGGMNWTRVAIAALATAAALFVLLPVFEPEFPGRWCADAEPWRVCYRNWLSSVSGWAAFIAAFFAGLLAWAGVQGQIEVQKRQTEIVDRTYWQNERNQAEVALEGLRIIRDLIEQCRQAFSVINPQHAYPYFTALKRLQPTGILDRSECPSTGRVMIGHDLKQLIAMLGLKYVRYAGGQNANELPEAENEIASIAQNIIALDVRIGPTIEEYKADLIRATQTLKLLDKKQYPILEKKLT
jgi:hypothetical protein